MLDVRAITEDEVDLFRSRLTRAFGADPETDDGARERFLELFEIERTFAALEDGDMIGTGGAFSFELTVPGEKTVPMAGTTIVSVQPTHRRRGVLTSMMEYHLDEVVERGEPVAGLWASEASIYGRFGFGPATYMYETKMRTPTVTMATPEPIGRVRLVDQADIEPVLTSVYEKVRPNTAGMLSRSEAWWKLRMLRESESSRSEKSARRFVVYEEGGDPRGYAIYRQKQNWGHFPEGEVHVIEVISASPAAHRGLWGYLTNIDLFPQLEWWNSPIDDALPHSVTEPRRVQRELSDSLWIRLMDVSAALEARRYEHDGEVVIDVEDPFRPPNSGKYRLSVSQGSATCQRVDAAADITCTIDVLGHLYLGGGDGLGMWRAGRIQGDAPAIQQFHRIFRTDRAPWCQEIF